MGWAIVLLLSIVVSPLETLIEKTVDIYYLGDNDSASCRFIVSEDSTISDVVVLKSSSGYFENKLKKAIQKSSGLWIPASQNGRRVAAYRLLKVTIQDSHLKAQFFEYNNNFEIECIDNIVFTSYKSTDSLQKNPIIFKFSKDSLVVTGNLYEENNTTAFRILDKKCTLRFGQGKREYNLITTKHEKQKSASLIITNGNEKGKIVLTYDQDEEPIIFNINL